MFGFDIQKRSRKSAARVGILRTSHGEVETPTLVTVATQASVKTLTSEEAERAGSRMLIANTFHLHLKPGEAVVRRAGGLHKFMSWERPIMTDSGGFQVFSLGFGRDSGAGKVSKKGSPRFELAPGQQPKLLNISSDGVLFTSPLDGAKIFLGPRESIRIQESLGADIIFAFDECPPPFASKEYVAKSLERTHRWASVCLKEKRSKRQALYGIVQGGKYRDLREESARHIASLSFDGFGIGGEFGADKRTMERMLGWVSAALPEAKPRHLLGIGYPEDIPRIIRAGVDTFDCIVPTHFARHGIAFTSKGRLDVSKSVFLKDLNPLDPRCTCETCGTYSRSYIAHLLRAKEIAALRLLTFHNLSFFNALVSDIRTKIKNGKF